MISYSMLPDVLELNSVRICGGRKNFLLDLYLQHSYVYQILQKFSLHDT